MHDLNDLYYFAKVIEHNGFSAASRAIGIPKSRLSRRLTALEEQLGARLIQRNTLALKPLSLVKPITCTAKPFLSMPKLLNR